MPAKTKTQKIDLKMATGVFQCFQTNMENFSDFTVIVGDFQFSCHKFVLGSCSSFFEALLRTDMREKSESSCIIQGISPQTFGLILDVVYKGVNVLNKGNMLSLWHASNQLQIQFLKEACELFIKENITTQNYWEIYQNANILESSVVLTEVRKTMVKSYFDIVSSASFMNLSLDDLLAILRNGQLETCADFAVSSILKWAYSPENVKRNYALKEESPLDYPGGLFDEFHCYPTSENLLQPKRVYPRKNIDADIKPSYGVPQQPLPMMRQVAEIEQNPENVKYRRSVLDQLLRVVRLNEISNECLTMLMNNEIIIENKSAIMLVNQQASSRLEQRYDRDPYYNQQQMYGHVNNQTQKACKHCGKAKNADIW